MPVFVYFDYILVVLILALVVTTTSITLSSDKIQRGDVPANPGPSGKMAIKMESWQDFCLLTK